MGAKSFTVTGTDLAGNVATVANSYTVTVVIPPVVAGPTKALLIREHARRGGHDLDASFAYSDSYSDVPMLSVVGHPSAVNPDAALERLAHAHRWPVVHLDRTP